MIVHLMAHTTTEKGWSMQAALDTGRYPTGMPGTDQALKKVAGEPAALHGEWNDTIMPRATQA